MNLLNLKLTTETKTQSDEPLILQSLKRRYATKVFDTKAKISDPDWQTLESALLLSPSGYGLQPWKFLIIRDPKILKQLTCVSLNQTQVEECSHFVVFASKIKVDEAYIESHVSVVARVRNLPRDFLFPYYQMMVDDLVNGPKSKYISEWAARQTYIALGTLVTAAAVLGVDTCPMEGIVPESYDEILDLKSKGYRTLAACALGYRHEEDKYAKFAKARFDKSQIIQYI